MQRRSVVIMPVLAFVAAAVLGAVGDWFWWQPYSGIVITLAAGAILLVAIVLTAIRGTRTAGLIGAVVGVGLIAGQNLGPSRPELHQYAGTMTITVTAPQAATGSQPVTCAMDAAGDQFSVGGDTDVRLDIFPDDPSVPADVDQREFFIVGLTVGDRWNQGPMPRPDDIDLLIIVGQVRADVPETRMRSAPSSTLELERSATGGTLSFRGLIAENPANEAVGAPVDLAGTLTWTCERTVELEEGATVRHGGQTAFSSVDSAKASILPQGWSGARWN